MISSLRSPDLQVTSSEAVQTFFAFSGERRATGAAIGLGLCFVFPWRLLWHDPSWHTAITIWRSLWFFVVVGGAVACWRWTRHDVIRVDAATVTIQRFVGPLPAGRLIKIARRELTDVSLSQAEIPTRGLPFTRRSLVFIAGDAEVARTLNLSAETARELVEVSRDWAQGGWDVPVEAPGGEG